MEETVKEETKVESKCMLKSFVFKNNHTANFLKEAR